MRINIIARINHDKDFFIDYVDVIGEIYNKHGIKIFLYFIGPIQHEETYKKIIFSATKYNILDQISFSKKTISLHDIKPLNDDIFLNACIGDFVGYSSIECVQQGFNTIFYNVDETAIPNNKSIVFCENKEKLCDIILKIYNDNKNIELIKKENSELLKRFYLTGKEKETLYGILLGDSKIIDGQ